MKHPVQNRVPAWLHQQLNNRPAEGSGLHQWIYKNACALVNVTDDEAAIITILTEACAGARRDTRREILAATHAALTRASDAPKSPKWPARDDAAIAGILKKGFSEAKLKAASPGAWEGGSAAMLELLFPGDPLLCIGFHENVFATLLRSKWEELFRHRPRAQFIVPSPMSAGFGLTTAGKQSVKTNANTGPRRYLVIEFDFNPATVPADAKLLKFAMQFGLENTRDMCAALADHFITLAAPLALVVWSGGKSLHLWFPVAGLSAAQQEQFFAYACRLGADPATWTPSQFVRLPWGRNTTKQQQQEVIYFAPEWLPQPEPSND